MKTRQDPRYINEFLRLRCAPDLLATRAFPNAKEITESFAAYNAVRQYGTKMGFSVDDPSVALWSLGDGHTPRTAATFAFRSAWECSAVDPLLRARWMLRSDHGVHRLLCFPMRIEDVPDPYILYRPSLSIIVAVHSHAPLLAAIEKLHGESSTLVVAIPCCQPQIVPEGSVKHSVEYQDQGIWSEKNTVRVWRL